MCPASSWTALGQVVAALLSLPSLSLPRLAVPCFLFFFLFYFIYLFSSFPLYSVLALYVGLHVLAVCSLHSFECDICASPAVEDV